VVGVTYILLQNSTVKHDVAQSLYNLLLFITFQHFLSDFISIFFLPSLELRNSFVPLICFHLAAPLSNSLPLTQLHISFTSLEPLAHHTPRFATHCCNLQHWFSKRHSPASTKQGTAILFLPSSYEY